MNRKKVDYTQFAVNPSETLLRQVFFKDQDLRFIWFIINDEHPITIPQLTRIFNKTYSTTHDRVWFYQKLNKVQNFGIFEKNEIYMTLPYKKLLFFFLALLTFII